jgi:endogenous inhibitor of DNA gyrase (YacG/DUF329 family)
MFCPQCGKHLGDSPSDDYCSEDCQQGWMRTRVGAVDLDDLTRWANATTWRWWLSLE